MIEWNRFFGITNDFAMNSKRLTCSIQIYDLWSSVLTEGPTGPKGPLSPTGPGWPGIPWKPWGGWHRGIVSCFYLPSMSKISFDSPLNWLDPYPWSSNARGSHVPLDTSDSLHVYGFERERKKKVSKCSHLFNRQSSYVCVIVYVCLCRVKDALPLSAVFKWLHLRTRVPNTSLWARRAWWSLWEEECTENKQSK